MSRFYWCTFLLILGSFLSTNQLKTVNYVLLHGTADLSFEENFTCWPRQGSSTSDSSKVNNLQGLFSTKQMVTGKILREKKYMWQYKKWTIAKVARLQLFIKYVSISTYFYRNNFIFFFYKRIRKHVMTQDVWFFYCQLFSGCFSSRREIAWWDRSLFCFYLKIGISRTFYKYFVWKNTTNDKIKLSITNFHASFNLRSLQSSLHTYLY